jgi:hypothetical protein
MIQAEVPSLAWQKFIERRFGLKIKSVKSYDSLYLSNVVKKVLTDKGEFAVKTFRGTEQSLSVLHRRIQGLLRKGYRDVPLWLKTVDDDIFVRWQGKLLYLIEWIDGRPYGYTVEDAFNLGDNLRLLHAANVKAEEVTARSFLEQRRRRIARALFVLRKETRLTSDPKIESWYKLHRNECIHLLETTDNELKKVMENLTCGCSLCTFVHGDVTSPNIIVVENRIRFIDWERLSTGLGMEELAKTVSNTALFQDDLIKSTLQGYQFWSLGKEEKTLFRAFFRIPREALHLIEIIQRRSKHAKLDIAFDIVSKTWDERLQAIRWVENHTDV